MELDKLDDNVEDADLEYSFPAFFFREGTKRRLLWFTRAPMSTVLRTWSFAWQSRDTNCFPTHGAIFRRSNLSATKNPPDSWYLPDVHGQVQWAGSVHTPARLHVILNVVPAAQVPGSHSQFQSRSVGFFLPSK